MNKVHAVRLAAVLSFVLAASFADAQCPLKFSGPASYAHGVLLELADVDEDGQLDTLTSVLTENALRVNFGRADGSFRRGTVTPLEGEVLSVAIADWNEDGHPDALVIHDNLGVARFLAGKGDATFEPRQTIDGFARPWSVAAGDFDGDRHMDAAFADLEGSAQVLWGNGDGTFTARTALPTAPSTEVEVQDLDRNGLDDVVIGEDMSTIAVLAARNGRTFAEPVRLTAAAAHFGIEVVDVDGDGDLDVAHADPFAFLVSVHHGKGDGTFLPRMDHPAGGFTEGVAFGHFDDDRLLDAVAGNSIEAGVVILHSNASSALRAEAAGFGEPVFHEAGGLIWDVRTADLNGDGRTDLIASDAGGYNVLLQRTEGGFAAVPRYDTPSTPRQLASADLDRDSIADIVAIVSGQPGVTVIRGNGDGTFRPGALAHTGFVPFYVVTGDVNRDGHVDLVVSSRDDQSFSVLPGRGDATFGDPVRYPMDGSISYIELGDVDGDLDLDLAACLPSDVVSTMTGRTTTLAQETSLQVQVFLNDGSGTFARSAQLPARAPLSLALADFNGDRKTDLAIAEAVSLVDSTLNGFVSIRPGNGDGTFGDAIEHQVGPQLSDVEPVDFDRDGVMDLATTMLVFDQLDRAHAVFGVYRNDGTGKLTLANVLPTGNDAFQVVAADIDGDGLTDLAGANTGLLVAFRNTGNFEFAPPENALAGRHPISAVAADFNRDGRTDFAVGSVRRGVHFVLNETGCTTPNRRRTVRH